jgi:uncharacterized protein YndB with AHSA1/START domain
MSMRKATLTAAAALIGAVSLACWADEKKGHGNEWAGIGNFVLNDTSLTAKAEVAAPCGNVWDVLTRIDLLQKWAPHLHLSTLADQKTAEKRGDVATFKTDKGSHQVTGMFVLASPVPHKRVQAVLVPDRGPWVRIQEWTLNPEANGCSVDYNESYNELWLKAAKIQGSGFIAKNRDHHIHVVLRRMKNIAEGKEAGPADEIAYLMQDAKDFPDKFRVGVATK